MEAGAIATAYRVEEELKDRRLEEIIRDSPALKQVLEQVETVAPTDASILILGETGTAKELIASDSRTRCQAGTSIHQTELYRYSLRLAGE
jgi:transcriptional regulator with GAF, ATPase, and Fis domain